MYDKDTTILKYADWLSEAEKEIRQLNTGQQFILPDLFEYYGAAEPPVRCGVVLPHILVFIH